MPETTARSARTHRRVRGTGRVLAVEALVLIAGLAFLRAWTTGGVAGWVVGGGAIVGIILIAVPFAGRSPVNLVRTLWGYRRRRPVDPGDLGSTPYDLIPLTQWVPQLGVSRTVTGRGDEVGVITDGDGWTAILSLNSDDRLLADKGEELNLQALSGLTIQDDIVFDGMQVVTYTVPAPATGVVSPGSPAVRAYREIIAGPTPPTVQRTWLCVRLDPKLCLAAITRRGAGSEGIYATLRFGLHRVQAVLKRQGVATRALSPVEIYEVLALTSGASSEPNLHRSSESWQQWQCDGLLHTGRVVSDWGSNASRGYGTLLETIAEAPVLFAVTAYTLSPHRPASGGIRLVTPNEEAAEQAAAFVAERITPAVRLGSSTGRQVPTLLATVPLGRGVNS